MALLLYRLRIVHVMACPPSLVRLSTLMHIMFSLCFGGLALETRRRDEQRVDPSSSTGERAPSFVRGRVLR